MARHSFDKPGVGYLIADYEHLCRVCGYIADVDQDQAELPECPYTELSSAAVQKDGKNGQD